MRYLIVVAHPDDEVIGAGGTISKLIKENNDVAVCFMCSSARAREGISSDLSADMKNAAKVLGVTKTYCADFPNIKMNNVAHIDLVKYIEECIVDFDAEAIITHHPSDTNNDHGITSEAVQAACRIFQRKSMDKSLKLLMYMEVLSSTEWSLDSSKNRFTPNYFVGIGKEGLDVKLKALSEYKGVMRDFPHPRSTEAITGLSAYRGAQSGTKYAEAFECVFVKV